MFYKLNLTAKYVQKLTRKISLETKSSFKLAYYCTNKKFKQWQNSGWLNTQHPQFSSSESLSDGGSKPVRRDT